VNRRGVALLLVLLAMLVTAALAAGVLIAASTQARVSGDSQHASRAAQAAERGVIAAAAAWPAESSLTMAVGTSTAPSVASYPDSTSSNAWVTRLSRGSFWVAGVGRLPYTGALPIERRIGVLHVLHIPEPRVTATFGVRDSFAVTGSARVDGTDTPPPGWGAVCSPSGPSVAGVAAPDTSRACDGPCGTSAGSRLIGVPPKLTDSAMALPGTLAQLGSVTWTSLAAHATYVLSGISSVTPGPRLTPGPGAPQCDSAAGHNWGDPTRATPCANRFVIVHARGDVVVDGGVGQGILLSDGDVELRNGAQFFGLIIARDDVVATTGSNRIWGAVIAGDLRTANGDFSVIAGTAVVTYSSCVVAMAGLGTAPLRREAHRAWAPIH
jgi:hypothetical protein